MSFFVLSCNNDDVLDSHSPSNSVSSEKSNSVEHVISTSKFSDSNLNSSTPQYSLFQNVNQWDISTGAYAIGEIYSPVATVATVKFGYMGSPASKYELRLPGYTTITSAAGNSVRTLNVNLIPGINTFQVCVLFSAPGQSANARISLLSIGGDSTLNADGYIDLVAEGRSGFHDVGGSNPSHSKCSRCGFPNSIDAQKCVSCGK